MSHFDTKRPIKRIACVGEVMIELVARPDGSAMLGVAGDTYNTAVYLARALRGTDVTVSYVTALGTDPYSDRIFDALSGHGLDTSFIERRPEMMPGLYAIDTDDAGERSFSYWRSASAARSLFSEPCDVSLERLQDVDLIVTSGITLAILPPEVRDRLCRFLDGFRADGGTVAYDSNYRPRLWESVAVARQVNRDMWQRADIALPSVDDEQALFGDNAEEAVLTRLSDLGVTFGALKRGAEGPLDLQTHQPPDETPQAVKVVDSTAAGDSFNAGYLAGIVGGAHARDAMAEGHRLAAKVIGHRGAIIPEP